jgi:hypothetical protein
MKKGARLVTGRPLVRLCCPTGKMRTYSERRSGAADAEQAQMAIVEFLEAYNGAITGIATVFLAIITVGLVIVAKDQSKTTRAQLRAYVMVETAITLGFVGPQPKAQVTLKNFGQTPAHDLTIWTSVEVAADPLHEKPAAPAGRADTRGPLAPGSTVQTLDSPSRIITAQEIADVQNGRAGFYVFGRARYYDVFGRSHITDFCSIYGGRDGCHPAGLMAQYKDWNKAT